MGCDIGRDREGTELQAHTTLSNSLFAQNQRVLHLPRLLTSGREEDVIGAEVGIECPCFLSYMNYS